MTKSRKQVWGGRGFEKWIGLTLLLPILQTGCGADSTTADEPSRASEQTSAVPEGVVVEVTQPVREELIHEISLPGNVEPFEKTTLYSRVEGYLEAISVDIGDSVKKGQVLAKVLVPEMIDEYHGLEAELEGARADQQNGVAELELQKVDQELAKLTYDRVRSVREEESDMMPQQAEDEARAKFLTASAREQVIQTRIVQAQSEVKRVEAALKRLQTLMEYAEIKAPFSGIVTERFVDPGALIRPGTGSSGAMALVTIAQLQRLRVFFDVPEDKVRLVQTGDLAQLTVDALPGTQLEGKVARFAKVLNPVTRSMKTEVTLRNTERLLLPGMHVRVRLILEQRADAILLPAEALRFKEGTPFVYVVDGDTARETPIETGLDDGIRVEVTGGLSGQERVIVTARESLSDGVKVRASQWVSKRG